MPLALPRRRVWLALGLVYVAALVASWIVAPPDDGDRSPLAPDERSVMLPAVGGGAAASQVRVVFQVLPPSMPEPAQRGALPVLMLHGSPGGSHDFKTIAPVVARGRRSIAPDLPGFGKSTTRLPDYSIRAHAAYMLDLLDRLGIARAHVVGYSMGGGVALEMAARAPDRVASVVLLASIGLQEFELTGRYWPNHAIHGVQLGGLWFLHRAFPHFGRFNGAMLSVAYARNFYDSDQRPLRAALDGLEAPVLILHGREDPLVPFEAAVEHHRRVPQSRLDEIPHGHFAPFVVGPALGSSIAAFVDDAERGRAPTRTRASPARIAEARRPVSVPIRPRGFGLVVTVAAAVACLIGVVAAWWIWRRRRRWLTRATMVPTPHG